jgi:purine-binding chemotaxis protein CheW
VSLRELLGMPRETPDRRAARIIVTEAAGHRVGLVVDAARSILRVAADAIDPVPPVLSRGLGEARIEAVCRLDDGARLVAILAPDGLFDVATLARLAALPQATTAAPREQHGATEQFLVFAAGENRYGLPVAAVAEVLRCPDEMTAVPRAPPLLAGMMSWRGIALPVIDPRRQFASHDATASPPRSGRQRVVVLTAADMRTGILVQDEPALLALSHAELAGLPELTHAGSQIFGRVAPIDRGDRMILLIDPSRLLSEAAREVVVACRVSHAAVEAAASCL